MANERMMAIGWATPDYHGAAGAGINFLTRLTLLREVNYDAKTMNLVSNPTPELKGLRTASIASMKAVALSAKPTVVKGTGAGAAASADVEITFSGAAAGSSFGACVLGSATNASTGLGIKITINAAGNATATLGGCSAGGT